MVIVKRSLVVVDSVGE
jgi:hypothetical protein